MNQMTIHKILDSLPHRYPFILVDRVVDYVAGETMRAIKNVTINEPYFMGHFPGLPVMPGVLIIEALAQTSILLHATTLSDEELENDKVHFFAGIDNARFKQVVEPGDQLILDVKFLKNRRDITKVYAEASVDGKLACSAELMSIRKDKEKA
jgi:3-hydroxyacyl-[acyl-carrier-protein] dehydratase